MTNEYRDRLTHWINTLQEDLYRPLEGIHFEGFTTMEQLSPEEAANGDFKPVADNTIWGNTWEYMWVRSSITLPKEAQGKIICLDLHMDCEATLFINGKAFGTHRADWVPTNHHYICDNYITENGEAGATYNLLFEVFSGHYYKYAHPGPILPGGSMPPKYEEGKLANLGTSSFGIWNEDAYQLYMDLVTLQSLEESIDQSSLRAAKIADALEEATRICEFELDSVEERSATYRAAREVLKPALEAENGTTAPTLFAVGNSHIDLAWLWPLAETYRKTERTFAAQLRLIEKYPDYRYIQSQPASYEMCEKYYPELYKDVKAAIKSGHWIAEGAMYVEPDTNIPSGEAMVRQLVFGKRFYREEFGIDSRMLWLPDTFGYNAALPQILKSCGVDYMVTQKVLAYNYNNGEVFPYNYFKWIGINGSSITTFMPTSYTYPTDPETLVKTWNSRVQTRDLDTFLIPYGYGDGGGGPCRDHIEYVEREKNLEGMPKVEQGNPVDFFDQMAAKGGPKNSYTGELYVGSHRGTLTSQANIKQNNRLSEIAMREMEIWGAFASVCENNDTPYNYDEAVRLWKILLLNQFHDILPGSSIERVYVEANQAHKELQQDAQKLTDAYQLDLAQANRSVTLFNSLSFDRTEVVDMPACFGNTASVDGKAIPMENHQALVTIPAMGMVTLYPDAEECAAPKAYAEKTADGFVLKNDTAVVRFNSDGEITSYVMGRREFAAAPMNSLRLYKDVPRKYDAWDVDSNYKEMPVDISGNAEITIEKAEGITVSLKMVKKISKSTLEQVITLQTDGVVTFATKVDWHETHRMLKVNFPVDVLAENAIHEIQFGYLERPTHRSRKYDKERFEVCNHRYTALQDGSHGAAVLNNCKYGVGVEGNSIELSLMRAPKGPDFNADQGEHTFTYAFDAWNTCFAESPVVHDALRLNMPVTQKCGKAQTTSFFSVDANNVIIDTVKLADDKSGDIIIRLYEANKADTFFTLNTSLDVKKAVLCDMLENETEQLAAASSYDMHVKPFEIKTIRFTVK